MLPAISLLQFGRRPTNTIYRASIISHRSDLNVLIKAGASIQGFTVNKQTNKQTTQPPEITKIVQGDHPLRANLPNPVSYTHLTLPTIYSV